MTAELLRERIGVDEPTIAAFCRKWRVAEMALFGSVVREDFRDGSDVDVLVTFEPGARAPFRDILDMQDELNGVLAREVDLLERVVIERSRNYIRREDILSTAQVIYAA